MGHGGAGSEGECSRMYQAVEECSQARAGKDMCAGAAAECVWTYSWGCRTQLQGCEH